MRKRLGRQHMYLALAMLVLVCATTACHPHARRVLALTGTEFRPRPPDYPIAVTDKDYETPYIALAVVTTQPHDISVIDVAGPQELRDMARQLGGDAVVRLSRNAMVVEEFDYRPGEVLKMGTKFEGKYTMSGIVVRFKRAEEAPKE